MLFKAGAISYDPQLIKPPEGYKGSDEINVTTSTTATKPNDAEAYPSTTSADAAV